MHLCRNFIKLVLSVKDSKWSKSLSWFVKWNLKYHKNEGRIPILCKFWLPLCKKQFHVSFNFWLQPTQAISGLQWFFQCSLFHLWNVRVCLSSAVLSVPHHKRSEGGKAQGGLLYQNSLSWLSDLNNLALYGTRDCRCQGGTQ